MTATASNWHTTSRQDYLDLVWAEVNNPNRRRVMEIGGTSSRSIGEKTLPSHVDSYTISDIDVDELAQVPEGFKTICLDACGDVSSYAGRFDLIVSKFCGEHMPDGQKFHRNVATMLSPGGVAIHIFPTLYASPFAINRLLPETLSRNLVRIFQPQRFVNTVNKFPAYYSFCRGGSQRYCAALSRTGFSKVEVHNYYGHYYYEKIPVLNHLENGLSRFCAKMDWSAYCSYAIVVTQK